jgi:hypothetical protein
MNKIILKDRAMLAGWIAGFLIAGALLMIFTQPLRARILLRAINKSLVMAEDTRRLDAPAAGFSGRGGIPGIWYTLLDSKDFFFVFSIMRDGVLIPCGITVTPEGKTGTVIPLGAHARQVFGRLPEGIIGLYVKRAGDAFMRNAAALGAYRDSPRKGSGK